MSFKTYIRRNIYKWHRITSLVIAIPVLLWTVSGFLHPVMSTFKPQVKSQTLPEDFIDTVKIKISLQDALRQHGITHFQQFRIVKMHSAFYYQVKQKGVDSLSYISCYNAQWLNKGDEQYAAYLAQRFLNESNGSQKEADHHSLTADVGTLLIAAKPASHFQNTNIKSVELVKSFSNEYRK